jgi:acyl-CoA thioesterase
MNDQSPHNLRLRSIMVGYFADWHQLEKIWTSARKLAASQSAAAALDDFLKEHCPPSSYKAK